MEDKLKKFVRSHREEFDTFEPRPDLWQDINRELEQKQSPKVIPFYQRAVWRYAAVVALLVGVGYGLVQYGKTLVPPNAGMASLEQIAPEMAEVETYYMSVINQKKRERNAYDLRQMGVETDFKGELSKLDSTYAQLKKELYTNPNKQQVIDAMVQNLQIRISILNEQLEVLNRIKQTKKRTDMQTSAFKSVTATALLSLCLQTSHYAQESSTQRTSLSKPGQEELLVKTAFAEESADKSQTDENQTITLSTIRRFDFEKSKRISKVFKVSSSDKLDIENKFGKVHINTWDKNEISVEVVMIARANSDERAQRLLDLIDVKINQSANLIGFKTQLESINSKGKQSFEVNYTISMPKNNPLRLKNSFGDAYVANLSGHADLNVEYGSLKTDDLSGANNNVRVSFGSGDLSSLRSGKLDVGYSNLTLGSSETLDLKSDFSDIKIDRIKDLAIRIKYGTAKLGTVGNVQGSSSFSGFRIRELGDKLDMRVQHGGNFEVDKIAKDFKSINLDGSFSSFELNFENNAAFSFDVDLDFGSLRLDKDQAQFSLVEKKHTSSHHIGKVGKANSDANVKIRAQYGDVRFEREN